MTLLSARRLLAVETLTRQREVYRKDGRYRTEADRARALGVFDRAIAKLQTNATP